jgi:uncharacterized protein YdaU (DUF1376 family)
MSSRAWMPLYIGDYLADTSHLDAEAHGVYLLLLMRCWVKGSIPSDRMQCMSIAHAMHEQSKSIVDAVIDEFFVLEEDGYHNKRVDSEREKAGKAYERRAGAASKRWVKERAARCNADAMHMQPQPQPQPQPQQKPEPKTKRQAKAFLPPTLEEVLAYCAEKMPEWHPSRIADLWSFYERMDWHTSKGEKIVVWKTKFANSFGYEKQKGNLGPTKEWLDKQNAQRVADQFNRRAELIAGGSDGH